MTVYEEKATMVRCVLRNVMAAENMKRADGGQPSLTQDRLAIETGLAASVINNLYHNRIQRVDYGTLDKLCSYFNMQVGALLVWEPNEGQPSGK
jgi:DNA-binding Xre family transcriptional regulator